MKWYFSIIRNSLFVPVKVRLTSKANGIYVSNRFRIKVLIFQQRTIRITKNWKIEITRSFFWASYAIQFFILFFFPTTQSVKLFLCIPLLWKAHPSLISMYVLLIYSVRASPERMKNRYTCRTWWHRFVNVKPLYMKTNVYLSYNTLVRLFMVSFTFLHFTLYLLLLRFENAASKNG